MVGRRSEQAFDAILAPDPLYRSPPARSFAPDRGELDAARHGRCDTPVASKANTCALSLERYRPTGQVTAAPNLRGMAHARGKRTAQISNFQEYPDD